MSRRLWPLATLAMVALVGAGCSNGGSGGGNTNAAAQEKAVKFAECMRENGVSKFPNPDASGRSLHAPMASFHAGVLGPHGHPA